VNGCQWRSVAQLNERRSGLGVTHPNVHRPGHFRVSFCAPFNIQKEKKGFAHVETEDTQWGNAKTES
jgi:hypothetical protein